VRELRQHYEGLKRPEAVRNLVAALHEAMTKIGADPGAGLAAPRPYPELARPGRAWVKAGRYWVCYTTTPRLLIVAVFFEAANIPARAS
jgi:plasmid stabilization system protein ParE